MGKKYRRGNHGDRNSGASSSRRSALAVVPSAPPKVSPERVRLVVMLLTVGGFVAIAADCWMSWEGFRTMPIDWWIAAALTAIVAISQLGSGVIQAMGGAPFKGVGGSVSGDGAWGLTLRALYGLDIFSNFSGVGGAEQFSFRTLWADPGGTLGLLVWHLVLAVLLAFGDEILFRIRDRVAIGSQANQQLAKLRQIQLDAHNVTLRYYRQRAMQQAQAAGEKMSVNFDFLEGSDET